ncbi:hypothetical protein [Turneriella parva]|uniref:Uncharacterized protein n=1 Tax=Turneriella parva (strain ATCC BAA-1111 / DSM 21527 / NCTC 11395 / H) TaxID=869212 RepID=I4B333_TURPD|nr:hypothetical protein [Turneriella parva]AFM11690.1 hypothetical protein Turpa_1041 [Turneriella parva DSM 21527]
MHILKPIRIAIIWACALWSCAETTEEAKKPNACEALNSKKQELLDITKDKSCSSVQDCKYIGYGRRSCGGVADYLIYSTKTVTTSLISAKVDEYNAQQAECAKIANGTAGPCVIAIEPVLACLIGLCTDTNP